MRSYTIKFLPAVLFLTMLYFQGKAQSSYNMSLLSRWDKDSLPNNIHGAYNDIWGYVDNKGREYAILGTVQGTYFFDVTNATNPKVVSYQRGKDTIGIHRDYKTYKNYAYGVCDEGNSSLQIFDLQYLPDSVVKVYDSDAFFARSHNIFINNDKLYVAGIKGTAYSMYVFSLLDPKKPVLLNSLSSSQFSYIHDVYVRNDTAFCSALSSGLFIYSYTKPASPKLIGSITSYPEKGFNHSSWVTENGKTLIFADENHGLGLKVYDISDLSNITKISIFRSNLLHVTDSMGKNGSIPHNPFILKNKVFISYYHDGVQTFDISNPYAIKKAGYYDTYPANTNYDGYAGCWGVYPYLPSKHIIASDISNGLFVLDGTKLLLDVGPPQQIPLEDKVSYYPVPFSNSVILRINMKQPHYILYEISDIAGKKIKSTHTVVPAGASEIEIDTQQFAAGVYIVKVTGERFAFINKLIKTD
jgi:choice-of-anchor B domain-containing protein